MSATARILPDGERLHLQHGPSDLVVWAEGARDQAYHAATKRFGTIIAELVDELPDLRTRLGTRSARPQGAVAKRMHDVCLPYVGQTQLTRMAAVAGAIADEVLGAMTSGAPLTRAYVNNGGDIALYLAPGTSFRTAISAYDGKQLGRIDISAEDGIGGIATSGRHGRSLSLGIADSVTVLARSAAKADVAATLVANAVDLPDHPAVTRRPAREVDEASDLGDLPVTVSCDTLSDEECDRALANGIETARTFQAQGGIAAAAAFLQGRCATLGAQILTFQQEPEHVQA
ncbi:UPF0280 family protein [Ruegeria sp. HKCCD7255]|uniref:UPF0280 family protein n=1 Tax=Ruegeria sp. HKCCD7255 TaxID=2683004 RepID=UPI0014882837|nr:UPF0280 family protein [Ruegeria sp. HKCCD7255]